MRLFYKIKEKVKENTYVFAIHQIMKDKEYREICRNFYKDGNYVLYFRNLGNHYPDKNLYIIYEGSKDRGLFSTLIWSLRKIEFAQHYNLIPVIIWNQNSPFGYKNSYNKFSDYFVDISGVTAELAEKSASVCIAKNHDWIYGRTVVRYDFSEEELDILVPIYKKYIRLKNCIQDRINNDIASIFGNKRKKVLGVHVRGVDWRNQQINGHPIPFTEEEYLSTATQIFSSGEYDFIYLATDSESTLKLFKNHFGTKLMISKATLTPEKSNSLVIFDEKYDSFEIGYEVLRDAHALATCNSLLCGLSYVSYFARLIKKVNNESYETLCIMDKGTVKSTVEIDIAANIQRNDIIHKS